MHYLPVLCNVTYSSVLDFPWSLCMPKIIVSRRQTKIGRRQLFPYYWGGVFPYHQSSISKYNVTLTLIWGKLPFIYVFLFLYNDHVHLCVSINTYLYIFMPIYISMYFDSLGIETFIYSFFCLQFLILHMYK